MGAGGPWGANVAGRPQTPVRGRTQLPEVRVPEPCPQTAPSRGDGAAAGAASEGDLVPGGGSCSRRGVLQGGTHTAWEKVTGRHGQEGGSLRISGKPCTLGEAWAVSPLQPGKEPAAHTWSPRLASRL